MIAIFSVTTACSTLTAAIVLPCLPCILLAVVSAAASAVVLAVESTVESAVASAVVLALLRVAAHAILFFGADAFL